MSIIPIGQSPGDYASRVNNVPLGQWASQNMAYFRAMFGLNDRAWGVPSNPETRGWSQPPPKAAEIPVDAGGGSDIFSPRNFGSLEAGMTGDPRTGAFFNSNMLAQQAGALQRQYIQALMGGRRF